MAKGAFDVSARGHKHFGMYRVRFAARRVLVYADVFIEGHMLPVVVVGAGGGLRHRRRGGDILLGAHDVFSFDECIIKAHVLLRAHDLMCLSVFPLPGVVMGEVFPQLVRAGQSV